MLRALADVLHRALATTSPPCTPAPGADIHYPVRRAYGVPIVLDDYERVAEVAQFLERVYELELSCWWRPMLASSRIYSTPMSEEPICVAALSSGSRRRRARGCRAGG